MKKILVSLLMIVVLLCTTACGGNEATSIDMNALYQSYTEYLPEMIQLDDKAMMDMYGVDKTLCKQAIIANCTDGLKSDEVWLIEANDAESAATIAELAQSRVDREAQETKDYLPDQYKIVEKAQIIEDGNNVVLIISADVDAMIELYNSAKEG